MQTETTVTHPFGDAALVAAVRGGDVQAFVDLVRRHQPAMRRLERILDPLHVTEDLSAEALAVACTSLALGHGPRMALRPYLLLLVRHLHELREAGLGQPFFGELAVFTARPFTDHAVGRPRRAVVEAVAGLPEAWQAVLWHLGVERDTAETVGRVLGVPAGTVEELAERSLAAVGATEVEDVGRSLAWHLLRDHAAEYLTLTRATAPRFPGIPRPRTSGDDGRRGSDGSAAAGH